MSSQETKQIQMLTFSLLVDTNFLSQQELKFEIMLSQSREMMSAANLSPYLSKSFAVLLFGINDYINNYLRCTVWGLAEFVMVGIGPLIGVHFKRASNWTSSCRKVFGNNGTMLAPCSCMGTHGIAY